MDGYENILLQSVLHFFANYLCVFLLTSRGQTVKTFQAAQILPLKSFHSSLCRPLVSVQGKPSATSTGSTSATLTGTEEGRLTWPWCWWTDGPPTRWRRRRGSPASPASTFFSSPSRAPTTTRGRTWWKPTLWTRCDRSSAGLCYHQLVELYLHVLFYFFQTFCRDQNTTYIFSTDSCCV